MLNLNLIINIIINKIFDIKNNYSIYQDYYNIIPNSWILHYILLYILFLLKI